MILNYTYMLAAWLRNDPICRTISYTIIYRDARVSDPVAAAFVYSWKDTSVCTAATRIILLLLLLLDIVYMILSYRDLYAGWRSTTTKYICIWFGVDGLNSIGHFISYSALFLESNLLAMMLREDIERLLSYIYIPIIQNISVYIYNP